MSWWRKLLGLDEAPAQQGKCAKHLKKATPTKRAKRSKKATPTKKKVAGKPRKSQATNRRMQARKLVKKIVHTVDLRQGSYETRQQRVEKLADFGPDIIPVITKVIDSVIYESHVGAEFIHAGEICAQIGQIGGDSAFDTLMKYFNFETSTWEYEYIRAGAALGLGYLGDNRAVVPLTKALKAGSVTEEVHNAIEDSLKQLGTEPPLTVDTLVKRFAESELVKKKPDFKGFSMSLRQFPKAHRAPAWWKLGWAVREKGDEDKAQKCFVKALSIDASSDFAAWGSLRPPIEDDERTPQRLKELKQKIGLIVDG